MTSLGKREFHSVSLGGVSILINIDEMGKIYNVSTNLWLKTPVRVQIEGNPHDETFPVKMKMIFHLLGKENPDMLREILGVIENSEPEYYSMGLNEISSF